jgi:hypothetical protein
MKVDEHNNPVESQLPTLLINRIPAGPHKGKFGVFSDGYRNLHGFCDRQNLIDSGKEAASEPAAEHGVKIKMIETDDVLRATDGLGLELGTIVAERMARHQIDYPTALREVTMTPEGARLYEEHVAKNTNAARE